MVRFKVVDNRTKVSEEIKRLEEQLDKFTKYYLEGLATEVVLESPVDTGTYITSHHITQTAPSGQTSSHGKPRQQDWETFAQQALNNLFAEIEAFGPLDKVTTYYIANNASHANFVEYEHGYAPYSKARASAGKISSEAAAKARSQ